MVVFAPSELKDAPAERVAERLVELGNEVIDDLSPVAEEPATSSFGNCGAELFGPYFEREPCPACGHPLL